jgi:transposase
MMLSEGQMNDQKGAAILAPALPPARELIAERGYDSNPFRAALAARGIAACIPSKRNRRQPIPHDAALYRQRHRIENMFGRLKDWRRIAMRYDRCAETFFAAITLAAIVSFWIGE